MMKLLAGVEEVSDQSEKQSNNEELHNNNHEKQQKTDVTQETMKLINGEVSARYYNYYYLYLFIIYIYSWQIYVLFFEIR